MLHQTGVILVSGGPGGRCTDLVTWSDAVRSRKGFGRNSDRLASERLMHRLSSVQGCASSSRSDDQQGRRVSFY